MDDYTGLKMPEDILNAALAKEKKSYDFYAKMSANCENDSVRDLIDKLKGEEYKHIHLIEDMLIHIRLA